MIFRKDINGLRAIAVIAVVFFHFNESWLTGGFAGVDVFFVISGFLMTGVIFRGLESNNFSILSFYAARANRIIPALAFLCLTLLIFGWFYLTPLDYKTLGGHVVSSLGFFSDIVFWQESELGYFGADSHQKWLLHTWSLSVEWQFYIIYPLVLVLLTKFLSLSAIRALVLFGMISGFIFCAFASYAWPNAAYYLLPARVWEMLLGGVAYLYPLKLGDNQKKIFEWFGLALIMLSYAIMSSEDFWPGYMALMPVIGAFLIIQAGRERSFIMNNIVSQKLGQWSYSIYLWHWPIVVAMYYFSLGKWFVYAGIILSVVVGFLSYHYIENLRFKPGFGRIKDGRIKDGRTNALAFRPAYIAVVGIVLGAIVFLNNGVEWHYPKNVLIADQESLNQNPLKDECHVGYGDVPECIYGDGDLGVIVIGDSHAQSIVRSVEKSLPDGQSVMDWTMSGCRTIEGIYKIISKGRENRYCGEFVAYALEEVKRYPGVPVIVTNRYTEMLLGPNEKEFIYKAKKPYEFIPGLEGYAKRDQAYLQAMNDAFVNTLCAFSENNPVFLLDQIPELKLNVPRTMAKEFMKGNDGFRVRVSLDEYESRHASFRGVSKRLQHQCQVHSIDVMNHFCDSEYCYGDIDGRPVYYDDDHLSEYGASLLIPAFRSAFKRVSSSSEQAHVN